MFINCLFRDFGYLYGSFDFVTPHVTLLEILGPNGGRRPSLGPAGP